VSKEKGDKSPIAAMNPVAMVGSLGEYLKEQRLASRLSLRQLADQVGVSNPYLSQIERGLRRPSAEVMQQLSRALRISAEQLYVRAGVVDPDVEKVGSVELAVLADPVLTERQKHSLLDIYQSFVALNRPDAADDDSAAGSAAGDSEQD
jgi:transcriptional regulator with XRE-family HTH domain